MTETTDKTQGHDPQAALAAALAQNARLATRAQKAEALAEARGKELSDAVEMMLKSGKQLQKERARGDETVAGAEALRAKSAAQAARIAELEAALAERQAVADPLKTEAEALRTRLAQLQEAKATAERNTDELRNRNALLQDELAALREDRDGIETERQRLATEARARAEEVATLEAGVQERIDEIATLSRMLLEAEHRLDAAAAGHTEKLRQFSSSRDNLLNDLGAARARLEELQAQMGGLQEKLTEETAGAQDLGQELEALRQREAEANERVDALLSSTSWKLTGPMRGLVTKLRN